MMRLLSAIGYGWPLAPDVNSHFGILDIAPASRRTASILVPRALLLLQLYAPGEGVLHLFPHVQQVENGLHPS